MGGDKAKEDIKGEAVAEPAGSGDREVQQGEDLESIAYAEGFLWKTLWDDPANKTLRDVRKHYDTLLPLDRLHIPELRIRYESESSETLHSYKRKSTVSNIRFRILWGGKPRDGEAYELVVGDQTYKGTTGTEAHLEYPIPASIQKVTLRLGTPPRVQEYEIWVGALDPIDSLTGVQMRLNNLGYGCGEPSENMDDPAMEEAVRKALKSFQFSQGLPSTGKADKKTLEALEQVHGS